MSTRKYDRGRRLTPTQTHDVWEIGDVDEITEEVQKVMRSMGLSTDEVKRAMPAKRTKEIK